MRRTGALFGVFFGVAALLTAVPAAPSLAAEAEIILVQDGPGNFFRKLFGGNRREVAPRRPPQQLFPGVERSQPQVREPRRERRVRAQPTPRAVAAVEKADDAKRVLVVGDFMASSLAKGLAAAYEENPNVVVIDSSSGSSGLVRDDFYDWPGKLPGLIEGQKPDAILVMIGGNDRQAMQTDAGVQEVGSEGWRSAYAARVAALADVLKASGKPALWSGLVPVESDTMSRDYSSFNGIVREQLDAKGLPFVDMWNGFADDAGKYVAVGPDVRGQSVQLRASDGLNFTRAGQRKLGYFVEQELNEILGGGGLQLAAADAAAALAPAPDAPEIGPMVPIEVLSLAGGDALSTRTSGGEPGSIAAEISARLADDQADPPPAGRVDAYDWPPKRPTVAAAEAEETPSPAEGAAAAR